MPSRRRVTKSQAFIFLLAAGVLAATLVLQSGNSGTKTTTIKGIVSRRKTPIKAPSTVKEDGYGLISFEDSTTSYERAKVLTALRSGNHLKRTMNRIRANINKNIPQLDGDVLNPDWAHLYDEDDRYEYTATGGRESLINTTLTSEQLTLHPVFLGSDANCISCLFDCLTGDKIAVYPSIIAVKPFAQKLNFSVLKLMTETVEDRRKSFAGVFERRAWGHSWDPSYHGLNASGRGATLEWSQEFTATLHLLINAVKHSSGRSVVRLFDVPCGDMAWMSRFLKTRDDVDYIGMDIVKELIDSHKNSYKNNARRQFIHADVLSLSTTIPDCDIIVNRMMVQHLFLGDIIKLLFKFSSSAPFQKYNDTVPKYFVTTSFPGESQNSELVINADNPGRVRKINLELPPISLKPPLCMHRDGPPDVFEGWEHFISVWRLPLAQIRNCKKNSYLAFGGSKRIFTCIPPLFTS